VVFSKVTLERIDQEAERAGLSRSALIRFTVRMFLMQAAKRLQGGEK
jgi:metal-responsive CopG/Arc/MetJ family transcriptional regulator